MNAFRPQTTPKKKIAWTVPNMTGETMLVRLR
jgi:hypothetical protein